MDYQCKKLTCEQFKQLTYETKDVDSIVLNVINKATDVYVFRSYSHLLEKNSLIRWLDSMGLDMFNEVNVRFISRDINNIITAENNEKIYRLNFTDENRTKFLELFKISSRDFLNILSPQTLRKPIYIDDPLYDQYDFIFVNKDNLILLTDIHPFQYWFNENLV